MLTRSLSIAVEINPGDIAINSAFRSGKDRRGKIRVYKSDKYKHARAVVGEAAALEWNGAEPMLGPVSMTIFAYWPGDVGDIDAPVKGVLDALEDAGVLTDDHQVFALSLTKVHGSDCPRLEIMVVEG